MQRLIKHCSFAGRRALAAGLGVCRRGDNLLAELQAAECLLPHLLLVGDAWLHAEREHQAEGTVSRATQVRPGTQAMYEQDKTVMADKCCCQHYC